MKRRKPRMKKRRKQIHARVVIHSRQKAIRLRKQKIMRRKKLRYVSAIDVRVQ